MIEKTHVASAESPPDAPNCSSHPSFFADVAHAHFLRKFLGNFVLLALFCHRSSALSLLL